MRWRGILGAALMTLVMVSCNSTASEEDIARNAPMDRELFTELMYGAIRIEGARKGQRMMGDSSYTTQFYNTLLEDLQVQDSAFEEAFIYYHSHPELMRQIYQEVLDSLQQNLLELNQKG